jgi:hypothetical protein
MFVKLIWIVKSISVSCQADAKSSHSATNSHTLSPIVRPYRVLVFGIVPFLSWIQYPSAAASKQQPATISTQAAGSQQPASSRWFLGLSYFCCVFSTRSSSWHAASSKQQP